MSNPNIKIINLLVMVACGGLFSDVQSKTSPNIVLILADDLGYSDLGSYGSEISTPNLDRLSSLGVRFANYHTAASCAPTRAMLITGRDSHTVGVPNIPEAIPEEQSADPRYQGVLSTEFETLPEMLKPKSYRTYFAGKWHLGMDKKRLPVARGFDRSLTMADTGSDNWEQKPYLPIYGEANWFEDGERIRLPDDFYSSEFIVDKTIEYIRQDERKGDPFFAFVSFMAVHIPVQAPANFRDRYQGVYSSGWESLARSRSNGLERTGILKERYPVNLAPTARDWDTLSTDEQYLYERAMQVYAGMVEAMDYHVGRLIDYLEQSGELENTVFVFLSDNGAEGSMAIGPSVPWVSGYFMKAWMTLNGYRSNPASMGERGSFVNIGPSWAGALVGPLSWFKFHSTEGGMRVPLVISGKISGTSIARSPGVVFDGFVWVTDLVPTLLQIAGIEGGEKFSGRSLVPALNGEVISIHGEKEDIGYELGGNKALFRPPHKLVYNRDGLEEPSWQLFNFVEDPGETTDLGFDEPELHSAMLKSYQSWAKENGVLEVPEGYTQIQQVFINSLKSRPVLLVVPLCLFLVGLAFFVYILRLSFRRR